MSIYLNVPLLLVNSSQNEILMLRRNGWRNPNRGKIEVATRKMGIPMTDLDRAMYIPHDDVKESRVFMETLFDDPDCRLVLPDPHASLRIHWLWKYPVFIMDRAPLIFQAGLLEDQPIMVDMEYTDTLKRLDFEVNDTLFKNQPNLLFLSIEG